MRTMIPSRLDPVTTSRDDVDQSRGHMTCSQPWRASETLLRAGTRRAGLTFTQPGTYGADAPSSHPCPELRGSGKVAVLDHAPEGRAGERKNETKELGLAHERAIGKLIERVHVGRQYGLQ